MRLLRLLPLLLCCWLHPAGLAAMSTVAGTPIFPPTNIWNTRVDHLPVDARSSLYIHTIGSTRRFHADFGSGLWQGGPIGIPYIVIPANQPRVPVTFTWPQESDPGPYPIPANAPIEGGPDSQGDRHILLVDAATARLYEVYNAWPNQDGSWRADAGAIYDLSSHGLRPAGWTSADAAGLPILPGLVRYEEAASEAITHAIRFTAPQTRNTYVWPARHQASSLTGVEYPPMGQRFRLKASVNITRFSPVPRAIARAMQTYGLILADNGGGWYASGVPDPRWDNDALHELDVLMGQDFEAVDCSRLMVHPDSGRARRPVPTSLFLLP